MCIAVYCVKTGGGTTADALPMCLFCMINCMTSGFLAVTSCGVAGVQWCRDWVRGGVEDRVGEFVLGERGDAGS